MEKRRNFKSQIALLLVIAMMVTLVPSWNIRAEASQDNGKAKTTAVTLKNPRIVKDSSMKKSGQKVTWDCVWFGSYPQDEVSSSSTVYKKLKNAKGWNSNNDITLDGVKYRRMKKSDSTSSDRGMYDWKTDDKSYHYFKYQPIKWRVLSVDGKKVFLLSDIVLDDQVYNITNNDSVTWKTSTVRSWLNGYNGNSNICNKNYSNKNFIDSAFNLKQKDSIIQSTIKNNNIGWEDKIEPDTKDKIFLLSKQEISGENALSYGFIIKTIDDWYLGDEGKICKSSIYASAMGAQLLEGGCSCSIYSKHACSWILRSMSGYMIYNIDHFGRLDNDWIDLSYKYGVGIRPALYLDISSVDQYQR